MRVRYSNLVFELLYWKLVENLFGHVSLSLIIKLWDTHGYAWRVRTNIFEKSP